MRSPRAGSRRVPRSRSSAGFSLIELIVALFLLSMTILALGPLMTGVALGTKYGAYSSFASTRLQAKIEELRNLPYASVVSASDTLASPAMTRTVTVVSETVVNKLKEIDVEVTWTERGATRHMAVRTFIANQNPP